MRFFDLPLFPRACLRRSLTLYSLLTQGGYPVEIHFGVRTDGGDLRAHSWVTLHGAPLAETGPEEIFRTIYSHSPARRSASPSGFGDPDSASVFS
jgi:hypothetical protein